MSFVRNNHLTVFLMGCVALTWIGCGGGKISDKQEQAQATDADPHAGLTGGSSPLGSAEPTDDHALPLKLKGLNSVDELKAGMEAAGSDEARAAYESGFRKTFTADAAKRDYAGATQDLEAVLAQAPDFAEAYRALGYARFNQGFNIDGAMADYLKAVELKPSYGEAHYALAFMYAMNDREKGAVHFAKAMELGIPDERQLKTKFYSSN